MINEPDLQRNEKGRALIGDMRNDENVIVSQIQLGFLQLHNRVLENITGGDGATKDQFKEAQRVVRWFYQYVVWNDFIKRLVPDKIFNDALKKDGGGWSANTEIYNPAVNAFIPVEFSVAAYRFGHSLVRPLYQVNNSIKVGQTTGFDVELPIFDPTRSGKADLSGFKKLKKNHTIQWDWFVQLPSSGGPFPQPSQLIDRTLSRGLFHIETGKNITNPLALLNIRRGWQMRLPSGTQVANKLGLKPMTLDDPVEDSLWVYILREAEKLPGANAGKQLGSLGGTIVSHVFAGLLKKDPQSFYEIQPDWTPDVDIDKLPVDGPLDAQKGWQFADIINASGLPQDAQQVDNLLSGAAVS